MKLFRAMRDTRGKESITLFFVTVSWVVLLCKFALAGINLGALGLMPAMGALEFGGAVSAVLLIWLGREWTEKQSNVQNS